jgi:hypothetical protein
MKKIFLLLSIVFSGFASFSQINYSKDTVITVSPRNTEVKPFITLTNTTATKQYVNWNLDLANCVIPSGYSITGICFLPSSCYATSGNVYLDSLLPMGGAGSSALLEPTVTIASNARTDSACIVKFNSNGKVLTFIINGTTDILSIAKNKPSRIDLSLYPMPATDVLNVVHNNSKVAKAVVFNVLGKKIQEFITPVNANGFSINTSNFVDGLYIIDVRDANNNSMATKRFTKN